MSGLETVMWLGFIVIGLGGSALYSGMETGAYSLNRVRLHLRNHRGGDGGGGNGGGRGGGRGAKVLSGLIARPSVLLGTLLIGNNATNYLGTASVGILFTGWGLSDGEVVLANALLITPLLFVFGETLPKDLFSAHSDRLMYRLAPVLWVSRWVFTLTGLLPLVNVVTAGVMRLLGGKPNSAAPHPRRVMMGLVREGVGQGLLSDHQSEMVGRVLSLSVRTVADEMTPWRLVQTVGTGEKGTAIRALAERSAHARFPVLDGRDKPTGVLDIYEALHYEPEDCPAAGDLSKEAIELDHKTPCLVALQTLQGRRESMAVVVDGQKRAIGIVSIKDLVEPITGELVNW